jgi:hypothetical protein
MRKSAPLPSDAKRSKTLNNPNDSRLRVCRVMDAWASLWSWPLTGTDGVQPPTLDEWIETCQALLGREPEARRRFSDSSVKAP